MNLTVEYDNGNGEEMSVGVSNLHEGRPLAENVRRALAIIPDGGHALAVYRDGNQIL